MLSAGPGTPPTISRWQLPSSPLLLSRPPRGWPRGPGCRLAGETSETWLEERLCLPWPQFPVLDKEGRAGAPQGSPPLRPQPPAVPGQGEPDRKGVAVELGAGRAALVRAALQEGVFVTVQVVHQVAIAAVLGDDVDGPCRRTGSATVPGQEVGVGSGFRSEP